MTLTRLLAVLAREPFHFPPQVVCGMTMDQIRAVLTDPASEDIDEPDDGMTERDYFTLHGIANCWPAWLTDKLWRERGGQ